MEPNSVSFNPVIQAQYQNYGLGVQPANTNVGGGISGGIHTQGSQSIAKESTQLNPLGLSSDGLDRCNCELTPECRDEKRGVNLYCMG